MSHATGFDPELVHVFRDDDPERQRAWFRTALRRLVRVERGELIAIKPNLGSPLPERTGATTALWMIEETARFVKECGAEPELVEAPSHIHDYRQVMEVTGAAGLCETLALRHGDARQQTAALPPAEASRDSARCYRVARRALEADGIICLPKMKTHNRTGVTLGIKGLMGLLAFRDRHAFHRRGVDSDIVELFARLRSRIRATLVDGIVAMEGHGPTNGFPVRMNTLVAGRDTLAVDAVGARIMGFDPASVRHLALAQSRELGDVRRPWMIHGDDAELQTQPFDRPRPDSGVRTAVITFPPLSAALRAARMGVLGRNKPVLSPVSRCTSCSLCADVCPTSAIRPPDRFEYDACIGCGLCVPVCPERALTPESGIHKLRRVVAELAGGLALGRERARSGTGPVR